MATALIAFKGTIAEKVLANCSGFDSYIVGSSKRAIDLLMKSGKLSGYEQIIAMGLKNRSRDDFVHVEQICFWRGKKLLLNTNLADGDLFKTTTMSARLEESYCNMLASALKTNYPDKQICFLHIPPRVSPLVVAEKIISAY